MQPGIERFTDADGKITVWPKKHTAKQIVLAYLIDKFRYDRTYSEAEINDILQGWHTFSDWPLLRRELFERGYMARSRDGAVYQRLR